jgi:predicted Rossmann fold flavoprotein
LKLYDIAVVGAGAAGLMAALCAVRTGADVLVVEKNNRVGEKLRISGGGRCNISNNEPDMRAFLSRYGESSKFLFSIFSQHAMPETSSFFEDMGLKLVTQNRNRMFPITENAHDVADALYQSCVQEGVHFECGIVVQGVEKVVDGFRVDTAAGSFAARRIILATGGLSHPETGSTGDGFRLLEKLGHTIIAPTPSIVPLASSESWLSYIAGATVTNAEVSYFSNNKKQFSVQGPVLFAHFGLSGPTILNSATRVADLLQWSDVEARINFFPDYTFESFSSFFTEQLTIHSNKSVKNALRDCMPPSVGTVLLASLSHIDPETKCHSFSKTHRRQLLHAARGLVVPIDGLMGFDRAVVADGGVPLDEINTKTMQSLKIPGLYIIGDLLHVNRPSGGFSLQLCWSTGYVAGSAAGNPAS